ncbi:MAG: hypoxanthine phosphoribosyltransferase [Anaerosomatales bacterium]|nr:hypoxanthine phosphoribosyltransferase [Anaerosomatales bacterium]MDT8434301.1 hypoxanthine phosphoribosyltransferase [Anaerosomatales bacterium]
MHPDLDHIVLTEDEIKRRVAELGEQVSRDYGEESILLIAVLRGAALFVADLAREITSPIEIDFMAVSSYGSSTESSGVVRIIKDLEELIEGRNVLVVEDIIDTGLTLKYLLKNLASRKPKTLEIVSLLYKKDKQRVPISCKYVGFDVPDEFVVGYGLDYAERYRNLPYIGVLRREIYAE